MSATITDLEPKRRRALELLLSGAGVTEVAAALSVNRSTVWRWRSTPEFALALAQASSERVADIRADIEIAARKMSTRLKNHAEGIGEPLSPNDVAIARLLIERALPTAVDVTADDRARDALQAAAGGLDAAREFIGAQVAAALGLGKVSA